MKITKIMGVAASFPDGGMRLQIQTDEGLSELNLSREASDDLFIALIAKPIPGGSQPQELPVIPVSGINAFPGGEGLAFVIAQGTRVLPLAIPTSGYGVLQREVEKLRSLALVAQKDRSQPN